MEYIVVKKLSLFADVTYQFYFFITDNITRLNLIQNASSFDEKKLHFSCNAIEADEILVWKPYKWKNIVFFYMNRE
jgi:hypothetical protein